MIDLLVLLTALSPPETEILFIKPGRGRIATTLYSSHYLNNDTVLKDHILFLHAFSGCDSTSALFGKGKISLSKILKKEGDRNIQAATTFKSSEVSQFEISEAGNTIFLALYSGKAELSLNKHRYICFKKGVAVGKKAFHHCRLPKTQLDCTVYVFIIKYNFGWAINFILRIGAGKMHLICHQFQQLCHPHQKMLSKTFFVLAPQDVEKRVDAEKWD